ncbi:MAG: aconitate hydratase AcnA [Alphaproteobacteria bacterium]
MNSGNSGESTQQAQQARQATALHNAARKPLVVGEAHYTYYDLAAAAAALGQAAVDGLEQMPLSIRILAENRLRNAEREAESTIAHLTSLFDWPSQAKAPRADLIWFPARVLLQDFTGVPVVADLAALREAVAQLGGRAENVSPAVPCDLVVDHSLIIEEVLGSDVVARNREIEYRRNRERYRFLKWGQSAFDGFRVVPPGTGIVHQVNLETLAEVVRNENGVLLPDTLVGADSHTTMINALGVLGWGAGGIEAEAALLGQSLSLALPKVVGVRLEGTLPPVSSATDLVLAITERLRNHGVVGKIVEFYGSGLDSLSLPDRATVSNMSPESGSTAALFPIDGETLSYLAVTGRSDALIARVEAYARAQGLWRNDAAPVRYSESLEVNLNEIEPALAGPSRPQDRVALSQLGASVRDILASRAAENNTENTDSPADSSTGSSTDSALDMKHGDVVIAAITSCTNTSNPYGLVAAGLLAARAAERGLTAKPWVKTSLAPGSRTVPQYLESAGLLQPLAKIGFRLVGFGCTTCIGNSGPLAPEVAAAVDANNLSVAAVLSGNRNFEGRIHPQVRLNYLASPMLVVAAALKGDLRDGLLDVPLGKDHNAAPVFLRDLAPTPEEIRAIVGEHVRAEMFSANADSLLEGDQDWQALEGGTGALYGWEKDSTYVRPPPFFANLEKTPAPLAPVRKARILALLGDSVTTDHISPAGAINRGSLAAEWLEERSVSPNEFNAFGARRGNHEVMIRGTFASPRLKNSLAEGGREGGFTRHFPSGEGMRIYDAATRYREEEVPLVVIAGREYGTGSSRDWAAKGPALLGVRAVLALSLERIHRTNLVGMGILPLEFSDPDALERLQLTGAEQVTIEGMEPGLKVQGVLSARFEGEDGHTTHAELRLRIDTADELETFRHGGILPRVARAIAA